MKVSRTLLVLGLFAALQSVASGQSTNKVQSASATSKTQIEPVYPALDYKLVNPKLETQAAKDKIVRVGNESSQAWTTIASRQPNSSVVHDCSTHEPSLVVYSLGHKPWR